MRRRDAIALLGGTAATWPIAAHAQQKTPVIGFLSTSSMSFVAPALLPAFRRGLEEMGYVEGRNVAMAYAWAEGLYDRLPPLAAELVRRRVDVIVGAGGTVAAEMAKAATATIPIVIVSGDDPVRLGFAQSINRPGGNVTGVAQLVLAAEGKRLELLRELAPDARTIAFLTNPARTNTPRQRQLMEEAARALQIELVVVEADADDNLAQALAAARAAAGALVVGADAYFFVRLERIVDLAARHALPTMYFFREFVTAGGLISYGSNLANAYYQMGVYAGRILKGADPGDLPFVQQSDKLELVVNLKAARALGLTVPYSLLLQANEVIE